MSESRRARVRWRARGLAVAGGLVALAGACASAPRAAPEPVSVDPPPTVIASGENRFDPTASLESPPWAAPAAPWIAPAVSWNPSVPAEGSAVAVHLRRFQVGREPLFVDADLDGVPVHLARTPWGWFGLGALPIGSGGRRTLALRFGVAPDSVDERLVSFEVRERQWPSARLRTASRTRGVSPEVRARLDRERRTIRATVERVTPDWLAVDGFDWPRRDRITSPFGQRRTFEGEVQSLHLGLDVAGGTGSPVRPAAAGRVALTGRFLLQGNAVYVDHGLGVYTGYFHLSGIDVKEGDLVTRADLLGRVGATGRVTGPHLHWSLYVAGQSLDPRSLLDLSLVPEAEAGATGEGR